MCCSKFEKWPQNWNSFITKSVEIFCRHRAMHLFSDFCRTVPILVVCLKTSAYCKQHWLCSKENWTHTSIPLWLWVLWWCSSSRFVLSQYGPRTNFTHKHFLLLHCWKTSTSILLIKELLIGGSNQLNISYFNQEWISITFIYAVNRSD